MVPRISTDSKGKVITRLERTYSNTDHKFKFHPETAKKASQQLEEIISSYKIGDLHEPVFTEQQIKPEPEDYPVIRDTIFENKKYEVSEKEATKFLNQWIDNAQIKSATTKIKKNFSYLNENVIEMLKTITTSKDSYHFTTTSRNHAGPQGYKYSKDLANKCKLISKTVNNLESSIISCMENANKLSLLRNDLKIRDKPKHLAHTALNIAIESYYQAFPKSEIKIDQRVNNGMTVLVATGVGIFAGLLTYFLH